MQASALDYLAWQPVRLDVETRLGAEIPATSLQARTEAVRDVLGAMRVPAVLLLGGDGASYREGYRQFLTMGVNPKAEVLAEELVRKARTVDIV